jgi:type I restriction enzyme S subunit
MIRMDEPLALVRSAALLRPNNDKIRAEFLESWLQTPYMVATMQKRANASSQANLFQNQIRALPVALPPLACQDRFIQRKSTTAKNRQRYEAALMQSSQLAKSLQHRAFRGEL